MGGQKPPKKGIRRVGGRTRRVDVIVHHTRVNRPAAEVAHAIDTDADRSRATGCPLSQRMCAYERGAIRGRLAQAVLSDDDLSDDGVSAIDTDGTVVQMRLQSIETAASRTPYQLQQDLD